MKPEISVILPVYNAEKYLDKTLDSVLDGSFSDFEIVAVNDGSTDSSLEILTRYAERDARVKVIDKPNSGVSDTRNTAIAAAEGEYIAFLDADDIYAPNYLERMHFAAKASDADVTVCSYVTFRGECPEFVCARSGEARPTTVRELLDTGLMTSMCVKLVKKNILTRYSIRFNAENRYSEDLFCSWKVCAVSNNTCIIEDKLYGYRLTGMGATSKCYDGLYEQYKSAFSDIRRFLLEHDLKREEENLDLSFTRGLPAFLLMIAREKTSLKSKIQSVKKILQDEIICAVLSERPESVAVNKNDEKMYVHAKKGHSYRLLIHGYYMDLRSKLANVLKH